MAGRESCKEFKSTDNFEAVALWPGRAGECR